MLRAAIISDIHYNFEDADAIKDKGGVPSEPRIYSTAQKRLEQFAVATKRYNPDLYFNLGDILDLNDSDYLNTIETYKTDLDAYFADPSKFIHIPGNHDVSLYGTDSITDFTTTLASNTYNVQRANIWSDVKSNRVAYTYDITVGSDTFRIIALCWADIDGVSFDDEAHGSASGSDQLDWLTNTALNTANPCIVLAHGHLTTSVTATYAYAYLNNAAMVATIQGVLEAAGNVIAVISVHFHRGTEWHELGLNREVVVNGIPYYHLMCSVLGRNLSDKTANHFYIFDFSTTGVERVTEFKKLPFDRARGSFGRFPQAFDRTRGRSDF